MKNNHLRSKSKMYLNFLVLIKKLALLLSEINYSIKSQDLVELSRILKINPANFQNEINKMGLIDIRKIIMECGVDFSVINELNKKMPYIVPNYDVTMIEQKLEAFKMMTTYVALSKKSYINHYYEATTSIKKNLTALEINQVNADSYEYIINLFRNSNLSVENFCIIFHNDTEIDLENLIGMDILTPAYLIKIIALYNERVDDQNLKINLKSNINVNVDYTILEKAYVRYLSNSQTSAKMDYLYNNSMRLGQLYADEKRKMNCRDNSFSAYQICEQYERLNPAVTGRSEGYSYFEKSFRRNEAIDTNELTTKIKDYKRKIETGV